MKKRHVIIFAFVAIAIGVTILSIRENQAKNTYIHELKEERKEKDLIMNTSGYPLEEEGTQFKGLNYFEPDLDYRITANLELIQEKKIITLFTKDKKKRKYRRYAHVEFVLHDVKNRLLLLESTTPSSQGLLFLPFADATSTLETYGGGRYLDVETDKKNTSVMLDFNRSYNPYCAYSNAFACPLPPLENIMQVAILAGEKAYP